jgi:TonB family protein
MTSALRRLAAVAVIALASVPAAAQTAGQETAATALLERGEAFLAQQEYRRAVSAFEQANRVYDDRCAECLLGVARAYDAWGRPAQAAEAARLAIQLQASPALQARAFELLGTADASQAGASLELLGEAEAAFRRVIALAPERNAARFNLAGVLMLLGRSQEAAAAARDYLAREPAGPAAREARILLCRARSFGAPAAPAQPAPAEAADAAEADASFNPPAPIFRQPAVLSGRARRAGLVGSVTVQVEVDAEGCATGATVVRGLGEEVDAAATQAVRRWVFAPATVMDKPVAANAVFSLSFGADSPADDQGERLFREQVLAKWPLRRP